MEKEQVISTLMCACKVIMVAKCLVCYVMSSLGIFKRQDHDSLPDPILTLAGFSRSNHEVFPALGSQLKHSWIMKNFSTLLVTILYVKLTYTPKVTQTKVDEDDAGMS